MAEAMNVKNNTIEIKKEQKKHFLERVMGFLVPSWASREIY